MAPPDRRARPWAGEVATEAGVADPGVTVRFTSAPAAVAVAQYALLSLAREHAPTLAAAEDLRLVLDEVLFAVPDRTDTTIALHVRADHEQLEATVEVSGAQVALDEGMAALVDELEVTSSEDVQVVRFRRRWAARPLPPASLSVAAAGSGVAEDSTGRIDDLRRDLNDGDDLATALGLIGGVLHRRVDRVQRSLDELRDTVDAEEQPRLDALTRRVRAMLTRFEREVGNGHERLTTMVDEFQASLDAEAATLDELLDD